MGYIPAIGCVGAIIPMTFVLFAKSFAVSMTGLFFTYFIGECWLGPGMAVLQVCRDPLSSAPPSPYASKIL